jgi:hypothetical protein
MNIAQFNLFHSDNLRAQELKVEHHDKFFTVEQWCPQAQKWTRVKPIALDCRTHFYTDLVPEQILEACDNYKANGYKSKTVLIAKEKHGDSVIDACDTETLGIACITLLQERKKRGYYEAYGPLEEPKYKPSDFRDDEKIYKEVNRHWETYQESMRRYNGMMEFLADVDNAINKFLYWTAYQLLESRDGEYERIELRNLICPEFSGIEVNTVCHTTK